MKKKSKILSVIAMFLAIAMLIPTFAFALEQGEIGQVSLKYEGDIWQENYLYLGKCELGKKIDIDINNEFFADENNRKVVVDLEVENSGYYLICHSYEVWMKGTIVDGFSKWFNTLGCECGEHDASGVAYFEKNEIVSFVFEISSGEQISEEYYISVDYLGEPVDITLDESLCNDLILDVDIFEYQIENADGTETICYLRERLEDDSVKIWFSEGKQVYTNSFIYCDDEFGYEKCEIYFVDGLKLGENTVVFKFDSFEKEFFVNVVELEDQFKELICDTKKPVVKYYDNTFSCDKIIFSHSYNCDDHRMELEMRACLSSDFENDNDFYILHKNGEKLKIENNHEFLAPNGKYYEGYIDRCDGEKTICFKFRNDCVYGYLEHREATFFENLTHMVKMTKDKTKFESEHTNENSNGKNYRLIEARITIAEIKAFLNNYFGK